MTPRAKAVAATAVLFTSASSFAACGEKGIQLPKTSPYYRGAVLFRDHCSGCHTLDVVGAQGSATSLKSRLRNQGPNFNQRCEQAVQVRYAIENGGFSGAIMPENILIGQDAQDVANFLHRYAGLKVKPVASAAATAPSQCPPPPP